MEPNKISPAGELAVAQLQRQPNPRQRILVVEEDAETRRLNTEVLICSGYHVDTAEDGVIAWNALQANRYDLMVTDNNIPKVSGIQLLKKLHATRLALPVIMATGTMPVWEFATRPWLQPATVLLKPYTFDELLGMVKKVLHATAIVRGEIAPPPNWQSQPSKAIGLG